MQFWNLITFLALAITGVLSASSSIHVPRDLALANGGVRYHESTKHALDPKDYNALLRAWRKRLKEDYQVRGLAEAKVVQGKAFLVGCNFNETFGTVPVDFLTEWNDFADRIFGTQATGWIYSDKFRWAFWRDIEGTLPCPRPWGVKKGEKYECPGACALLQNWVGS